MLTQTSELAIRSLLFIVRQGGKTPVAPRQISGAITCSPTYLAKTLGMLVRAGILRSMRGSSGGVLLAREPERISLLDIVEACQGLVTGDYCQETDESVEVCGFHKAMRELHQVTVEALDRWTLAALLKETPEDRQGKKPPTRCRMHQARSGPSV
jgi:Rrf2 family protein